MFSNKQHLRTVRTLGVALVAAVGFAGCATYDDEFATINNRLDTLDTRVQGAAQSAESANQAAQQANQRLYPFITGDQGTAKEALDTLAADWKATFEKYGRGQ